MAVRFTGEIIAKCEHVAALAGLLGRARPELRADIRSIPFKSYLIFFRYLPSETDREVVEIVNVLEGHRDLFTYSPMAETPDIPFAVTFEIGPDRKASQVTIEDLNDNGQGVLARVGD